MAIRRNDVPDKPGLFVSPSMGWTPMDALRVALSTLSQVSKGKKRPKKRAKVATKAPKKA